MNTRRPLITSVALIGFTVLGEMEPASSRAATQLVSSDDCNFVIHVPGLVGGTDLRLRMRKGAVFTEDRNHKFCGPVAQKTPVGESNGEQCFVITDGKLVSGSWSNKVTSSNCVLMDAAAMRAAFVVGDLSPWAGSGAANLRGQAFLKTVGGDVKTCAGERVLLLPETPYVDELLDKARRGISASADPGLMSYVRTTICDAQGSFSFAQLPAQRWYVLTRVTWGVPHVGAPGDHPGPLASLLLGISAAPATDHQGGELQQVVVLSPGDNQIFLTYRDER